MTSNAPLNWLITGCDKGMGRAIAWNALQRGHRVAATVLAGDGKSSLTEEYPDACSSYHLDVTDHAAVRDVVARVERDCGSIDVLVNNAGFGLVGAAEETDSAEYRPMFEVNFFGLAEVTRAVLAGMRARRRGHIISISSLVGIVGLPGFSFYSASKFAVEGFSESLAAEVRALGIRVSLVEPGGFRTDFAGGSLSRARTVIGEYAETSGQSRARLDARNGKQPGDPMKLGAAICEIVEHGQPPLRLPLGADCLPLVLEKASAVAAECERWRELSLSTSFDTERA